MVAFRPRAGQQQCPTPIAQIDPIQGLHEPTPVAGQLIVFQVEFELLRKRPPSSLLDSARSLGQMSMT